MNYSPFRWFLILLLLFLAGCGLHDSGIVAQDADTPEPGLKQDTLQHDGLVRVYRFYVPETLAENPALVILLHGGGGSMDQLFRPNAGGTQEWVDVADDHGFILMVPNGVNIDTGPPSGDSQNWNDCRTPSEEIEPVSTADDVGFISRVIGLLQERFDSDKQSVFSTGSSNGGMMTYRLAAELPDKITAGAAFIANVPAASECPEPSPVPMMMMVGTDDTFMPFEGGSIIGNRGEVLSSEESREFWLNVNRLDSEPFEVFTFPSLDNGDDTSVTCERYGSAQIGETVRYCVVDGGGHISPSINHPIPNWLERILGAQNRDLESAREAWEFFQSYM